MPLSDPARLSEAWRRAVSRESAGPTPTLGTLPSSPKMRAHVRVVGSYCQMSFAKLD